MNQLGSLGPVVFEVNDKRIRTFSDFTRSASGRWANHEVLNKKPKSQRIGPGLDTVSFTMRFDVSLGLNPRKEMDRLTELEREGKVMPLIIGGKPLGVGKWKITSVEQSWPVIDNQGNVLVGTVNISLEEYV